MNEMAPLHRNIGPTRERRRFLALVAVGLIAGLPCESLAADPAPGVLILHSNQRATPAQVTIDDTVRTVIAEIQAPVQIYSEYLDDEWDPARETRHEAGGVPPTSTKRATSTSSSPWQSPRWNSRRDTAIGSRPACRSCTPLSRGTASTRRHCLRVSWATSRTTIRCRPWNSRCAFIRTPGGLYSFVETPSGTGCGTSDCSPRSRSCQVRSASNTWPDSRPRPF